MNEAELLMKKMGDQDGNQVVQLSSAMIGNVPVCNSQCTLACQHATEFSYQW